MDEFIKGTLMKLSKLFSRSVMSFGNKGVHWLVAAAVVIAAGAGLGVALGDNVTGMLNLKGKQGVYVDVDNLTAKDIGRAADRKLVTHNKAGTQFSANVELNVGDELVFDLPLVNESHTDAVMVATIENLPAEVTDHIEVFWDTLSRSASPSLRTATPDPLPVTVPSPQNSDTQPSDTRPAGIAPLSAQSSDSTLGVTPPLGLPANPTQILNTTLTNSQPNNSAPVADQEASASATNTRPTGSPDISSLSKTVGSSIVAPIGAWNGMGEITTSAVDATGDVGEYTSVAAADANNLFASYYDATNGDLKFARSSDGGSTWTTSTAAPSTKISIKLGASSVATVRVAIAADDNPTQVEYLVTSGSAQLPDGPDSDTDPDSISTDPLNPTVVIYTSTGNTAITAGGSGATISLSLVSGSPGAVRVEIGDNTGLPASAILGLAKDTLFLNDPDYIFLFPSNIQARVTSGSATVTVGTGTLTGAWSTVTPDGTGNITIQASSANTTIELAEKDIDDDFQVVLQGAVGQYSSIAAADASNLFISYYDAINSDLRFVKSSNGGATWSGPTSGSPVDAVGNVGLYTSIAVAGTAPNYDVFVSYYDESNGNLKFAKSTDSGATWPAASIKNVDSTGDVGKYSSIAVAGTAPNYDLFVSYYDVTNSDLKFVKSGDGGATWSAPYSIDTNPRITIRLAPLGTATVNVVTASSAEPAAVDYLVISGDAELDDPADPASPITISDSYKNRTHGFYTSPGIKTIRNTDGIFDATVQLFLVSDTPGAVRVEIGDSTGLPTSAILGLVNDALTLRGPVAGNIQARVTSGSATVTVGTGTLTGAWSEVTPDAAGDITIRADSANTTIELAEKDADDDFQMELVRIKDQGQYSSIAVTGSSPNYNVFISYYDATNNDLRFARSTDGGATWPTAGIKTVDSTGDVGAYASIDATGSAPNYDVLISYYDATNNDLKVAKSADSGATWPAASLKTIESAGLVGSHTSIDAINATTYFISYYDIGNDDLKVAKPVNGRTWYPGSFNNVDVSGDGSFDTLYFVLTDWGSDGDIDLMEVSTDDQAFGEVTPPDLSDQSTGTNNDEQFYVGDGTSTSYDIDLGAYLFSVSFQNAVTAGQATASITAKTWYTGLYSEAFALDADADGDVDDRVHYVLSDTNSNGLYDTMDISMDDALFGEGTLTDQVAGSDNDERVSSGEAVLLGDYYTFSVSFTTHPFDATADAWLTSQTWYLTTFNIDADLDGAADDTIHFAMTDTNSDGLYEAVDISLIDTDYGQKLGDGKVRDDPADTNNDERITAPANLDFGTAPWRYAVSFDSNPAADSSDIYMTSQSRFTGKFVFDADADGVITAGSEDLNFVLSDADGDGLYDTMDLSLGDLVFGDGYRVDERIEVTNDERISLALAPVSVFIGTKYAIWVAFDPNPLADSSDARITLVSKSGTPVAFTSFTGWFIDADGDEIDGDRVYFVLSDTGSDGVVDTIDISIGDQVYGEGNLTNRAVNFNVSNNTDDERIPFASMPYPLKLGTHWFRVTADTSIYADTRDAYITSCWYVGTFPVDVDNDQRDDTLDFVQIDPYSRGLYTVFELDGDDSDSYEPSEVHANTSITRHFFGLWGTSESDIFAVGYNGMIRHYNGTVWSPMTSTVSADLHGVWGTSASNVFAVGAFGTVIRYNGTSWTAMASGTTERLYDIWGSSASDIYAVGDNGTILHYNGAAWGPVVSGTIERLYGIWGSSATDIYAVGTNGTIIHYDGIAWGPVASGTTNNLMDVWGSSASDIFAVGYNGTILRGDGLTWTAMSSSTTNHLLAVHGLSSSDIYAVGYNGTICHYEGSGIAWSTVSDTNTTKNLTGVWAAGVHDVFAVGYVGTTLYYDGVRWNSLKNGLLVDLEGHRVWLEYRANPAISSSAVLTDGNILEIARLNPEQWMFIIPSDPEHPEGVQSALRIKIALPDDVAPGFFKPIITIEQRANQHG